MTTPLFGGCLCGAVRYECSAHPLWMHNCHCRDCQRASGGPYLPVLVVPLAAFKITEGELQHHATTRLSGRRNLRGFCGTCGSTLTAGEDRERNLIGLVASSLDDPSGFKPAANIFVCDAQPWDVMDASLPKYQHYQPRSYEP